VFFTDNVQKFAGFYTVPCPLSFKLFHLKNFLYDLMNSNYFFYLASYSYLFESLCEFPTVLPAALLLSDISTLNELSLLPLINLSSKVSLEKFLVWLNYFFYLASYWFESLCQYAPLVWHAVLLLDISTLNELFPLIDTSCSWGISVEITTEITTEVTPNDEGLTEPEEGQVTITGAGGPTPVEVDVDPGGSETDEPVKDDSSDDGSSSDSDSDTP